MHRLSLSTWSIHRALGPMYASSPDGHLTPNTADTGAINLLDVPQMMAAQGVHTHEICHFHFPSTEAAYLQALRGALDRAGVELFSLLIDAGDLTHADADQREADLAWIRSWLDVAGQCGATHARVIAGQTDIGAVPAAELPDHPVIRLSADGLRALAAYGRERGVRVITENFRPLTNRAENILAILDLCDGAVGLCADFGNFRGPTKYDALAAILPHADSVHAKAYFDADGTIEREDFTRCLNLSTAAAFGGPYSLIYEGTGEEWAGVAAIRDVVATYV